MRENPFVQHTLETAPPASRRPLERIEQGLGHLPAAASLLASSPHLLEGFQKLNGLFESTTLDPLAREVLVLTVAVRNGCHLCVAMHTKRLAAMEADEPLIADLRAARPLAEPRLEAVRAFTVAVMDHTGDVPEEDLDAFLGQGYTPQQALEVVLGIGTYTLTTFANRLTRAPVDEQLAAYV